MLVPRVGVFMPLLVLTNYQKGSVASNLQPHVMGPFLSLKEVERRKENIYNGKNSINKGLEWSFLTSAPLVFLARQAFVVRAVLCRVGCPAASLVPPHGMPGTSHVLSPMSCDNLKGLQTLPKVPCGATFP